MLYDDDDDDDAAFGEHLMTSPRGDVTKVGRRFERFPTRVRMSENRSCRITTLEHNVGSAAVVVGINRLC